VILDGAKPDGLSSLETNVTVTEILDASAAFAASGKTILLRLRGKEWEGHGFRDCRKLLRALDATLGG